MLAPGTKALGLLLLCCGCGSSPVPIPETTPDPTLLPVASAAQAPLAAAYAALDVPGLAAGQSYLDPTTGVRIHKITSGTYPAASAGWVHDYAEGGNEISLPYAGQTRAILVRASPSLQYWLVDFTPGSGLSNARRLTSPAPWMDLTFTFSSNPATPWYAYVSTGGSIVRLDIRTMTAAPGDGWPVGEASAAWLHQSEGDGLFVWMRGPGGSTAVAYEPGTATLKTYTNADLNEPRIDRAGRYVGMSLSTRNVGEIWDFTTASVVYTVAGDPGIPFAHIASLRRRWMGVDWNETYPPNFTSISPEPGSAVRVGKPANGSAIHGNGSWIQHPADLDDQWALFYTYGGLRPPEDYWLSPGGMVLITPNGQRRLLGHPYNTSRSYGTYSFCKLSPDGRYVLFTSDMNGSPRSDLFLAEMPAR